MIRRGAWAHLRLWHPSGLVGMPIRACKGEIGRPVVKIRARSLDRRDQKDTGKIRS